MTNKYRARGLPSTLPRTPILTLCVTILAATACRQAPSPSAGGAPAGNAPASAAEAPAGAARAPTSAAPAAAAATARPLAAVDDLVISVYLTPTCGCCGDWVDYMRAHGYTVETTYMQDLSSVKARYGMTNRLASCHTAVAGDYVIEGHVPEEDIRRMLADRPQIAGIAVPGMPMGSPGMEGPRKDRYNVVALHKDGQTSVYASH